MNFECSVESLWDIVSSANYLNNVHPFCSDNSIIHWDNDKHEDKIVYLNGLTFVRNL